MPKNACFAAIAFAIALAAAADDRHVPAQYSTIQSAIAAAKDGDHVVVAPGTYGEALDLLGKQITLRSSGGAAVTILDGDGHTTSILTATSGESAGGTIVRGFTFRNGYGNSTLACSTPGRKGGAVFLVNAGLSILDSVFEENGEPGTEAGIWGGAIWACEADLAVLTSRFEGNGGASGGIDYTGTPTRRLTVAHTTFRANRGGALIAELYSNSSATIEGSQFHDNEAGHGGAVFVYGAHSSRTTIERSVFVNNTGRGTGGGVKVFLENRGTLTLSDCRFDGNRGAHGAGINVVTAHDTRATIAGCDFANGVSSFGAGAVLNASGASTIDLSHCDFRGHQASFGGGVFATAVGDLPAAAGGRINITGNRFFDNEAQPRPETGIYYDSCFIDGRPPDGNGKYFGGGADLRTITGGTITVASTLFAGNTSFSGGGGAHAASCAGGTIQFINTTIVENESGVHARLGVPRTGTPAGAGMISVTNSIVRDNAGAEIAGTTSVTYTNVEGGFAGAGNMDLDPLFVNAAARDYRLTDGSACIDAGDNTHLLEPFRTDVTGRSRFVDDPKTRDTGRGEGPLVDLGAYEFQPGRRRTVRR